MRREGTRPPIFIELTKHTTALHCPALVCGTERINGRWVVSLSVRWTVAGWHCAGWYCAALCRLVLLQAGTVQAGTVQAGTVAGCTAEGLRSHSF